jgi:UDP-N-acetylmuramate dehydrogenase
MQQYQNVSLKDYSTMRLGGMVSYVAEINTKEELKLSLDWADAKGLPVIMIGDGSNIFWKDEGFQGLLLVNKLKKYEILERDPENVYITAGAGENWDSVVERTVREGLTGIEALSFIPGTTGATPVQNVGAYGQEISDVFVSAEVYDRQEKKFIIISKYECEFSYRMSKFKRSTERGRYFICAITLHLARRNPEAPFYQALERFFNQYAITEFTPQVVRDAVVKIRSSKLPDPAEVANNGSFFANPIIDEGSFAQLQADHPGIVHWRLEDGSGVKLSAAWLIEQSGFKDYHDPETGMATWPLQPLVLVNEKAQTTADLLKFRDKIANTVLQKFSVGLIQEPELLP